MVYSLRHNWLFLAAIFAPGILLVGLLVLFPVLNGVRLAFTDASPLYPDVNFIGFENFTYLFEDPGFREVIWNTIKIVGSSTIIATVIGYFLATILNAGIRAAPFFRAAIFQVWVVPWIVIAILWGWLFNSDYGLINYLLKSFGIIDEPIRWLFDQDASQWTIAMGYAWRAIPFIMVICLAGLQGIPAELVESAEVDGASFLQRQRHILLPLMRNIILVAALLQAVRFFQELTLVFVLTQGGPVNATMVLSLYTYKTAFENWDFGLASAIGTIWLVLILAFALLYVRVAMRQKLQ